MVGLVICFGLFLGPFCFCSVHSNTRSRSIVFGFFPQATKGTRFCLDGWAKRRALKHKLDCSKESHKCGYRPVCRRTRKIRISLLPLLSLYYYSKIHFWGGLTALHQGARRQTGADRIVPSQSPRESVLDDRLALHSAGG